MTKLKSFFGDRAALGVMNILPQVLGVKGYAPLTLGAACNWKRTMLHG